MGCCICQKTKTTLTCGSCQEDLCKSCTEFVNADQFSFYKTIPTELTHGAYCSACYIQKITPQLAVYEKLMEKARQINVFDITQGKETRLIKRLEPQMTVIDCADKDETVLRLAFWAAERGFNSIVDMDLQPKKVRDGRYQHRVWTATAIPVQIADHHVIKDRSIWSNPN